MMTLKTTHWISIIIMVLAAAGLIVWDFMVIVNDTDGDSISALIYEGAQVVLLLPFAMGCLNAHFFFPSKAAIKWKQAFGQMIGAWAATELVLHLVLPPSILRTSLALVAGCIAGHFSWPNLGRDGA